MKIFADATKIFSLVLSLFFVNSISGQSIYTLPVGTRIEARMDNEINSKISSVGDTFTVTVSKPLIIQDREMLPIGTILEGKILQVASAGFGKRFGSLKVRFETLQFPDGEKRQIEGELLNEEKPKSPQTPKAVLLGGGTIIGALFGAIIDKSRGAVIGAGTGLGIGASAVFLQKGKEARIKADEEVRILLKREVTLPVENF